MTADPLPHADVAVIGAGIVGVTCALQLAERGLSVTLLDRQPPCRGASYGNAGVISPWGCVPQSLPGMWRRIPRWLLHPEGPAFVRIRHAPRFLPWAYQFLKAGRRNRVQAIGDAMLALSRNSPESYRRLLAGTNASGLVRDSLYIFVYRSPEHADLDQYGWQLRRARKVPLSRIGAEELRRLEPALSERYRAAIVIHDQARALDPAGIGAALADKAVRLGVRLRRIEVRAIARSPQRSTWTVVCEDGETETNSVVLAAGVWSAGLLGPLGIRVPLEAERGYHLQCRDAGIEINNSIMDTERLCVASRMDSGVRAAGTAEFAGIEAEPDYRRAHVFRKSLHDMFPAINTDGAEPWMGRRPSLPDSLPCIGPIPGHDGLFAAFGHAHHGLSQAPRTGSIIADCITGSTPDTDLAPYRTDRFQ